MEEKERYKIHEVCPNLIVDTVANKVVNSRVNNELDLLNHYFKRIKELEKQLAEKDKEIDGRDKRIDRLEEDYYQETRQLEWVNEQLAEAEKQLEELEESYNNTMRYLNKTRSELLNLPKKIVEDIKEWIKSQIIYCGGKANDVDILIANASNQVLEDLQNILDTILKKYENEIKKTP